VFSQKATKIPHVNPSIKAIRAITATVFQRVYRPIVWVGAGCLGLVWLATIWLSYSSSAWWLLIFVVLFPVTLAAALITVILWQASKYLYPRPLRSVEKTQILKFADKVISIAEIRSTPMPVMVFFIAKDVFRHRKSRYVENIIDNSASLKDDFLTIRNFFA
jgi:hypothetical protein